MDRLHSSSDVSRGASGYRDPADAHRTSAAGAAALETAELHRLLVERVREYAIFALNRTGHVLTWNEGAQRIKGYAAEEIIGRHFSIFYPESAVATGFPQYELSMASKHGSFEDEGERVRRDGTRFWASVVITALRDEAGELVGFAKVTRDLTDRREAEQRALMDARRMAEMEASNRTRSEFLAMVSHELRTPLNAIGGYTDLLALEVTGALNPQQQSYLQRIQASQRHLLVLVSDLLNLSRIETGVQYRIEPVRIGELVAAVEAMILPLAGEQQIAVEVSACDGDVRVHADVARTQQILLNLLSNAVKFTPVKGRVAVSCEPGPERVSIHVADTGPGIPADRQEIIFEPFVQLGRSLTSIREGLGLGLSISRELARGMAGDLTVRSEVGHGSTFTLSLPRAS